MINIKISYILLFFILLFYSCNNKRNKNESFRNEYQGNNGNALVSELGSGKANVADSLENIKEENILFNDEKITSTNINNLECDKCDIQILLKLDKNIDSVSYNMLYQFLCTFDNSCSNNIEFTQFSNEVLFETLEKYPEAIVEILSKNPQLNREYIYNELSSPLLDYDYKSIINLLKSLNGSDVEIINKIIKSVEIAMAG